MNKELVSTGCHIYPGNGMNDRALRGLWCARLPVKMLDAWCTRNDAAAVQHCTARRLFWEQVQNAPVGSKCTRSARSRRLSLFLGSWTSGDLFVFFMRKTSVAGAPIAALEACWTPDNQFVAPPAFSIDFHGRPTPAASTSSTA